MEDKKTGQKIYRILMIIIITALITFMVKTIIMYNKFDKILYKKTKNGGYNEHRI